MGIVKPFLILVGVVVGGVFAAFVAIAWLTSSPLDSCLDAGGIMENGQCIGARNSKTGG